MDSSQVQNDSNDSKHLKFLNEARIATQINFYEENRRNIAIGRLQQQWRNQENDSQSDGLLMTTSETNQKTTLLQTHFFYKKKTRLILKKKPVNFQNQVQITTQFHFYEKNQRNFAIGRLQQQWRNQENANQSDELLMTTSETNERSTLRQTHFYQKK